MEEANCELEILRLLVKNRGYYDKYFTLVKPYISSKDLKTLYETIDAYYQDCQDHMFISEDDLKLYFTTNYPQLRGISSFDIYIEAIYGLDLSSDTIKNYIHKLLENDTYKKVCDIAQDALITRVHGKIEDIERRITEYKTIIQRDEKDSPFLEIDMKELLEEESIGNGFKWRLNCLNDALGPLGGSTLGHIFARPEVGKTSMLTSELSFFATQLEDNECVILINNEEAGKKVKFRIMQAALKATKDEILSKIDSAISVYINKWGNKLKIVDNALITYEQIHEIVSTYKPKCLVIDQGDKVRFKGDKDMSLHERLKALYVKLRELAKEFDIPIITIGQASGEAEGKKWLSMDMMDNSKCLAVGTKVRMFDGSTKCIENVFVGEQLMGVDGTPRTVRSTDRGTSEMWEVTMAKTGDSFICNNSHILSTKMSGDYSRYIKNGQVVNKTIHQWMALSPSIRYRYKGYYSNAIQYNNPWFSILDPYFLGVWLGDGSSRSSTVTTADPEIEEYVNRVASRFNLKITEECREKYKMMHISCGKVNGQNPVLKELQRLNLINNKHILKEILTTSIRDRQEFLAGLVDTDGCLLSTKTHKYFEVATKYKHLCRDLIELCRSLGLYASYAVKYVKEIPYYYVYISGDLSNIPTKIARKQTSFCAKTQVVTSPMTIKSVGQGEYAGFTLDGDGLYMLDNYIVTHNTGKPGEMDWILGIGSSHSDGEENIRYLRLAKNKLTGNHLKTAVLINPEIARYSDMG